MATAISLESPKTLSSSSIHGYYLPKKDTDEAGKYILIIDIEDYH